MSNARRQLISTIVPLSLLLLTTTSVMRSAQAQSRLTKWPQGSAEHISKKSIEILISQFVSTSYDSFEPCLGSGSYQFAPLDDDPSSGSSSIRHVIAIGLPALPYLIDHLTDTRRTRLVVKFNDIETLAYGNMFDARPYDRDPNPRGTTSEDTENPSGGPLQSYTVTVGDVCYAIIGQIVGRDYIVMQNQDDANTEVTSLHLTPAIGVAVKAEWTGLTRQEHIRSLLKDTYSSHSPTKALQRLCFYYPSVGKATALAMLARPICNYHITSDFIHKQLLDTHSFVANNKLRSRLAGFVAKNGPAYYDYVWQGLSSLSVQHTYDSGPASSKRAARVLQILYPNRALSNPNFTNAADEHDQQTLVDDLQPFHDKDLENAIRLLQNRR